MKTRITIELELNASGIPFVERPPEALLECRCAPVEPGRPASIEIQGNEAGLRWLAEKALAVANARPDGYHVHLGKDEGLLGGELIIARRSRQH
ncbi:Imm32 family immunity protein [Hyalangium rubrum]|uniref:Uncharacterized protein n=1 Tax=Hyalangium rubrum TaxID=3103134 RepID=A0ABU5H035_9BACT|nr:hypothetical protein [Hyalangium sp. s54d21]MDY7226651.1 hypothetical protein [Hyalangium sp. s54d21]